MRVFSVFGTSLTGKTTTIENIIKELIKRNYTVGSVKEIHYDKFAIDTPDSNTDRHHKAGSQLVTARGYHETDVLFQSKLSMEDILRFYNYDFVVLEGVTDCNVPKIISAAATEEIDERLDDTVFAISGKISNEISEYKGIPVINGVKDIEKLVNLIEKKVFTKLPDFPPECCSACGYNCSELAKRILQGKSNRSECTLDSSGVKLFMDDKEIEIVPFVKNILHNAVEGVVSELDGYRPGAKIEIKIDGI